MHPNSIANLRPAWRPGETPNPTGVNGQKRIERALQIAQNACPKAAKLIANAINDQGLPMSTRLRCAEYVLDKVLPTPKGPTALSIGAGAGVEWLELRFTAPGGSTTETHRISLEPTIDNDIRDITPDANGLEHGDE